MLIVESAGLEIGSTAKRYRTSMAKYLPKPLRTLYRGGRARAVNGLTSSNAAISKIKRQSYEKRDFSHNDLPDQASKPWTDRTGMPRTHDIYRYGIETNGADIRTFECALVERDH
jgi:hypothetical protein